MPAHRSALSARAPRPATGGRHRAAAPRTPGARTPGPRSPGARTLGARAAVLGATGATTAAILGLGVGLAVPLDAGAAVRPSTTSHRVAAVHHEVGHPVAGGTMVVTSVPSSVITPPRVVHAVRTLPRFHLSTLGVRAVRLAATRAGDPYVYGAEGPRAFDCSGLVQWVYDHLHRELPRTAGAQYDATRHISHSQARPGDLIFFASGGQIYHVAIYAGHGWIWAAPYPGRDVEKEKLWTNDYLVGRVR